MLRFYFLITLFIFYFLLPSHSVGQVTRKLPQLYPVANTRYDVPEGLPDPCVALAHINKEGKLVLVSCNHVRVSFDLYVYFFDGHESWNSTFDIEEGESGIFTQIKGISRDGLVYGYYYDKANWGQSENTWLFIYDPSTAGMKMYPFGLSHPHTGLVEFITETEEGFFILTRELNTGRCEIFHLKDDILKSVAKISNKDLEPVIQEQIRASLLLEVTPSDFWVANSHNVMYRISRQTQEFQSYVLPHADGHAVTPHVYFMMATPDHDILFYSNLPKHLYRWNKKEDRIQIHPFLPQGWKPDDVKRIMLTKDETGNLLVVHQRQDKQLNALLLDQEGSFYDYTPVISHLTEIQFLGEYESSWCSRDFRKELFITSYNFACIEVAFAKPIQAFPTYKGVRGMLELGDETLLVRPIGILDLKQGNWKTHPVLGPDFSESNSDLRQDAEGKIWSSPEDGMNVYDPATGKLDKFACPEFVNRFDFLDASTIVYVSKANNVFFLDKTTGVSTLQPIQRLPAFVNQVYVDAQGIIWVATSEGLIKINRTSGTYERIDQDAGLEDARIVRMYQDKRGRFWLGSFLGGVQIYDPSTGDVKIINQRKGLTNNTVASILEDDDGFIWVGTYNGLTILDPEGEIFGQVYKQDGLVHNECNRWSSYKLKDGRLCIGSVGGLSIIEPRILRKQMELHYRPLIYLTKLGRGGQAVNVLQAISNLEDSTGHFGIELPAGDRSLHMGFALSNYSARDKCSFAYKIEGHDNDWNYIGSQNEITLNRLPTGNYRILVSGADHRGKRTEDPVVIEVYAHEYFYLQWWFYSLLLIPLAGGALFYQYRQRLENKKLELEVLRRTETIQNQADQLREMDIRKSHLYTNITHEFRTPLTVIEGMVDQLSSDPKAPELIKRNTRNLLHLVNQMLDLSKLESGAMPLYLVQNDILGLIRYIAESYKSLAESRAIHFHYLSDEAKLVMDYDPEKIRQVISNLLSNAIKFTPKGGEVYLQVDTIKHAGENDQSILHPTQLVIKVRDTGIGIPEDKIQHIFKRFYQIDTGSTRVGEGTGIGLTLVSELVRLMGGEINVNSKPGQGSSFTLTLPVRNTAPITEVVEQKGVQGIEDETFRSGGLVHPGQNGGDNVDLPSVLITEDHEDVLHYITLCLGSSFSISTARNGQEGIDAALEQIPDVIISDVMMPVKDGYELCDTLKNDIRTSHIPILLLTARADMESRITGIRKGADAYLSKPFDKNELVAQLENLIENRRKLQQRYAGMQLSPSSDPETALEDSFVLQFRQFVEAHLDNEDLDVNDLCRAMALSRAQLHRKIKALTGKSASAVVRSIRLEKAKEMLKRKDLNITQVAYEVGFRYPEYFSRAFSEEFGKSPSQWLEDQS